MNTLQPVFNPRIKNIKPSLIREIINVDHHGQFDRISLGLGELQFAMPKKAQLANAKALQEGKSGYTPNAGLLELRKKVAAEFSSLHAVSLTHQNVIITSGSTGALFIAFETLLDREDEVLIPELHYPLYVSIPESVGAKIITYRLKKSFEIDVDDVLSKISSKTKLIVVNSPSNPTGHVQKTETLKKLAEKTSNNKHLFFLSDEIYSTFLYGNTKHTSIASFADRVIITDGLSKRAAMTGKRLGWFIAPELVVEQAFKVQQYAYACAPSDSQFAALSVLSGECDDEMVAFQSTLSKNRKCMLDGLTRLKNIEVLASDGAFYCLIDIAQYGSSIEVAKRLIEEVNVVTVPGFAFGKAGDEYLRLSFAGSEENIREGILRMKGVFASWN